MDYSSPQSPHLRPPSRLPRTGRASRWRDRSGVDFELQNRLSQLFWPRIRPKKSRNNDKLRLRIDLSLISSWSLSSFFSHAFSPVKLATEFVKIRKSSATFLKIFYEQKRDTKWCRLCRSFELRVKHIQWSFLTIWSVYIFYTKRLNSSKFTNLPMTAVTSTLHLFKPYHTLRTKYRSIIDWLP